MGTTLGPPFVEAIGALVGVDNIAVQGVNYPASILGFLEGGDADGSALMANLTTQAMTQCPKTKVVMSGYR
jgi:cutinase